MLVNKNDDIFNDSDVIKAEVFVSKFTNQYIFCLTFDVDNIGCCNIIIYAEEFKEGYKTGDEVGLYMPDPYCIVDVYDKYFFPEFCYEEGYQWYHPDSYSDDIKAMAEVLEYARRRGLEEIEKEEKK